MPDYFRQVRFYGVALMAYLVLNAAIWHLFTRQFSDSTHYVGGLARLSYLAQYAEPRLTRNTFEKRRIVFDEWRGEEIDLITIGDSFSAGGGGGDNSHYQDWLVTLHGVNVLNLPKLPKIVSNIETAHILIKSGLLDELSPRALLLEDVGRWIVKNHGRNIDRDRSWTIEEVKAFYTRDSSKPNTSHLFLNSGNLKFLTSQFLYLFDDNTISSQVYRATLKQALFSKGAGTTLLFYAGDIDSIPQITDESVALVAENLNVLGAQLAERGIALYYMPVVDKFDLYYGQIQDSSYPRNPLFEKLRACPRDFHLIDTKAILSPAIASGEKDIFRLDDTHWTWKACKLVSEAFAFPPSAN